MAYYAFIIKKKDISIEVETNDHSFIDHEMTKWLESIAGTLPAERKQKQAGNIAVNVASEKKPEISTSEILLESQKEFEEQVEELAFKSSACVEVRHQEAPAKSDCSNTYDEEISPEKTKSIELALRNVAESIKEATQEAEEESESVIDIEDVISQDSDVEEPEENEDVISESEENSDEDNTVYYGDDMPKETNKFYQILQKKISTIPGIVGKTLANDKSGDAFDSLTVMRKSDTVKNIETIEQLVDDLKPQSLLEYLLLASYHLKECENFDRYSLKQINARIINFTKKPIDHSVIQEAVSKGYLEVVPDYTGIAGVTEYEITAEGEKHLVNG